MWREHPGAGKEIGFHPTDLSGMSAISFLNEISCTLHDAHLNACSFLVASRLYVLWLNGESLEYGGGLVGGLGNA